MQFTGENIIEFADRFTDDQSCLVYLADIKWGNGYTCKKCGHDKFTIRKKNLARDCNRCHHIESPTAHTLFHKLRFGIRKAFFMVFEFTATTKSISSSQAAKRYGISRTTAWSFSHRIRKAMESSKNFPMTGEVHVDEFVFGGKENLKQGRSYDSKKKKLVGAVELSEKGGVKRVYIQRIDDYSSKSLQKIFHEHIAKTAIIKTDKWSGYIPLKSDYNITQELSDKGNSMKQLHTIIHQVKSWLRTVYSWVDDKHIEKYLDEYCYRINRSVHKETIFDNLITRMVEAKPLEYKDIILSN